MKRSPVSKNYFTVEHEKAILEYVAISDRDRRTVLYESLIGPVFDEMVDKIVFSYNFTSLPNINYLKDECKIWLTTILEKFNPDKSKAFTYFTVVTKNWFIAQVKKKTKRSREEINIHEMPKEIEHTYFCAEMPYNNTRETEEFILNLKANMIDWEEETTKTNDEKVLKAIQVLFESVDDIEIFNKKAIYLYLRELTGLNTKQVVSSLKRTKILYYKFKQNWDEGDV